MKALKRGLVLQLAQPQHVVGQAPRALDMAIEHGGVGLEPTPWAARILEPLAPEILTLADQVAHATAEDLGAATGSEPRPASLSWGERLGHAEAVRRARWAISLA